MTQIPDVANLRARIHGRVQGVSFRYFVHQKAHSLRLTGWVKNERDGTVSVEAEGPRATLEELLIYLREGSPASRVERVDVLWSAGSGAFEAFAIRWL